VHDALTWENGRTEFRSGMARLVAEDRISLSYDDMLGGTDLWLRVDGFTFSPYQIPVAIGHATAAGAGGSLTRPGRAPVRHTQSDTPRSAPPSAARRTIGTDSLLVGDECVLFCCRAHP
jgi:hypothetical protein